MRPSARDGAKMNVDHIRPLSKRWDLRLKRKNLALSVRYIETQAETGMRCAIVAPHQEVVPVAAEKGHLHGYPVVIHVPTASATKRIEGQARETPLLIEGARAPPEQTTHSWQPGN